jgi:hypothetical protein
MHRHQAIFFRALIALVFLCSCFIAGALAQTPEPSATAAPKPPANPFAPPPAPPLPAGMTGADTNDPRYKLTPGVNNAGETAFGMKHLVLVKKPGAFQLGTDNPDDPKVNKTLGLIGVGDPAKIPGFLRWCLAQLAFANSDLAVSGQSPVPGKLLRHQCL